MRVLSKAIVLCLVLTLLADSFFAAPAEVRSELTSSDNLVEMLRELPVASTSLIRKKRNFAQMHQGRNHYYDSYRRRSRFERRHDSRRRHRRQRIHHAGAGQIVYE